MKALPLAIVALLLAGPPASALHQLDQLEGSGDVLDVLVDVPEEPLFETQIEPVDRNQRRALETVNEVFDFGGEQADGLAGPVLGALPEPVEPVITLYRDGIGTDPASGRLGDWRQVGHDVWGDRPQAAHEGGWGFTSATRQDGTYTPGAASLLVTPELDLRTGFHVTDNPSTSDAWWKAGHQTNDTFFWLRFHYRHNLGNGFDGEVADGVDIWVLREEGLRHVLADPASLTSVDVDEDRLCPPDLCRKVNPFRGHYTHSNVAALGGQPGFSGYKDWGPEPTLLNLTDWAEERVWVVFRFASGPAPVEDYFDREAYFQDAGWWGFQLDDVTLRAPAPPTNLQVHELDEPSGVAPGRAVATYDWQHPIPVQAFLRNTGGTPIQAAATVSLVDQETGEPVPGGIREIDPVALAPGQVHLVSTVFPARGGDASLRAEVVARIVGETQALDADPGDDAQSLDLVVQRIRALEFLDSKGRRGLEREAAWVDEEDPFNVTATLRNGGTVDETVTVLAQLLDARNGDADVSHLLNPLDLSRTYEIPAGGSTHLKWSVSTHVPGQYKLLARTSGFDPATLPAGANAINLTFKEAAPALDGNLAETAWEGIATHDLEFEDDDGETLTVQLQGFHDGDTLHLGLTVPDDSPDTLQEGDEDRIAFYFDDRADKVLADGGEDGFLIGDQISATQSNATDLAYDRDIMWWVPQAMDRVGEMARRHEAPPLVDEAGYTYEVKRPIGGSDPILGMEAATGDRIGFYAALRVATRDDSTGTVTYRTFHYPADAATRDNGNGDLGDETLTWARLHLLHPPDADLPPGDLQVSQGFGVGMGPPLLYPTPRSPFDLSTGCPAGWNPGGTVRVKHNFKDLDVDGNESWNCAMYSPEGRRLLYEGMTPGSTCNGRPCLPYSGRHDSDNYNAGHIAVMTSPEIPFPDVENASLVLQHQFSTTATIRDGVATNGRAPSGRITVLSIAWVTAEYEEPKDSNHWVEVFLVPGGGYSTESNTLPDEGPPRVFFKDNQDAFFCSTSYPNDLVLAGAPNCGWWSPTGFQRDYRPPGDDYPVGGAFHGSPWRIDTIPLSGAHANVANVHGHGTTSGGTHPVDLGGKDVRFKFHFSRANPPVPDHLVDTGSDAPLDLGWRIAAMAVTDGEVVRNARLEDLRVETPYDAERLGLGPGTGIPLAVTLRNTGNKSIADARVRFAGVAEDGASLCTGDPLQGLVTLDEALDRDGIAEVRYVCQLPPDASGRVAFTASMALPAGDDLPVDDVVSLGGLQAKATPDAAVTASVTPGVASADVVRTLRVEVRNIGNLPITSFDLTQTVARAGFPEQGPDSWAFTGTIPVGERRMLNDVRLTPTPSVALRDRFFDPGSVGEHALVVRLSGIAGESSLGDNLRMVPFRAVDALYQEDFSGLPKSKAGIVQGTGSHEGTPDAWRILDDPDGPGNVLRAGDPGTGEVEPLTDAAVRLPAFDLRGARSASLSVFHEYDLEDGYDGARIELSADGGTSWEVLEPARASETDPGPGGYPSSGLFGENPLQGSPLFTGRSFDPATGEPSVVSEFDLGQATALQEKVRFADFGLLGLDPFPSESFTDPRSRGDRFFAGAGWGPDQAKLDGWLVENVTHNDPRPHSGDHMWWSGSSGELAPDLPTQRVGTQLRIPLNLPADKDTIVSWHDWRAGWRDRDLEGLRDGTGGLFEVYAETATERRKVIVDLVDREPGGWSLRQVDLSDYRGQVTLEFSYLSALTNTYRDPAKKNNEGWFLDDISIPGATLPDGSLFGTHDLEDLFSAGCSGAGPFDVDIRTDLGGGAQASSACWQIVERGAQRDGAWHLETLPQGPQGDAAPAWRMSSADGQGYPNQANTRLITPPVDLGRITGTSARLQFDHRYGFEAETRQESGHDPIVVPGDGGVVEVQVYDPASATWGPWQLLTNGPQPGRLVVTHDHNSVSAIDSQDAFDKTGYQAIYVRGEEHLDGAAQDVGVGSPFDPLEGLCASCGTGAYSRYPVTPAFSGDSAGWQHEDWDISTLIGKRVRFAYHAWSNPQDTTAPDVSLEGWSVTNVGVEGTVFRGAPVEMRLRLGTDGSRIDGHWAIEGLELSGELYPSQLRLSTPLGGGPVALATLDPSVLPLTVGNIGTATRRGLAIAVDARDAATGAPVAVSVAGPDLPLVDPANVTVAGAGVVWGPFSLTGIGTAADTLLATLEIDADPDSPVEIRLQVLEDNGGDVLVDGTLRHIPAYGPPRDTRAGISAANGTFVREDRAIPVLVPFGGSDGYGILATPDPANDTAVLQANLTNAGTVAGEFVPSWSIEVGEISAGEPVFLFPGESRRIEGRATRLRADIQHATLTVTVSSPLGENPAVALLDFPFTNTSTQGEAGRARLWKAIFDNGEDGLPARWPARDPPDEGELRFRTADGALVWGVMPNDSGGYCDAHRLACGSNEAGHEAHVVSNLINLTDAMNGRAELVMRHDVSFVNGKDGGRLEASPVSLDGLPLQCDGAEAWMPLEPTSGFVHNGVTSSKPNGRNPLGDGTAVFQGVKGNLLSRYDLALQPDWCAGGAEQASLMGHDIALRYHVGIQGGAKEARKGWTIDSTLLESGSVRLGPRDADGSVELPVFRNVPKAFAFTVANDGPIPRTFDLQLEDAGSWVELRNGFGLHNQTGSITLAPGEVGTVALNVTIPETLRRSAPSITLRAASQEGNFSIEDRLPIRFQVKGLDKPNLALDLNLDGNAANVEAGVVVQIHAEVSNNGKVASKPVPIRFDLVDPDNTHEFIQTIETLTVPALCGSLGSACSSDMAKATISAEWSFPGAGRYAVRAIVDPKNRTVETDRSDNTDILDVTVIELQVPDLRLEALSVAGVGPDGLVESGSLLAITATVVNEGFTAVPASQVRIYAGSVTLTEADLPILVPGARVNVTAFKLAPTTGDQLVLRAVVLSTSDPESDVDDNEARQVLTLRRHDLAAEAPAGPIRGRAGEVLSATLTLRNHGNSVEPVNVSVAGLPPGWVARVLPARMDLPPGGSALAALIVQVPKDAQGGDQTANVTATGAGQAMARTNVRLRIDAVSAPPEVALDTSKWKTGPVDLLLRLRPHSNVAQDVWIRPGEGDLVEFQPVRVALPPGPEAKVRLPATIFANAPAGPAALNLSLEAADGTWSQPASLPIEILPTLRATARWTGAASTPLAGDGARLVVLTALVQNNGNVELQAIARGLLSQGSTIDPPQPLRLAPGASANVDLAVRSAETAKPPTGDVVLNLTAPGHGGLDGQAVTLGLPDLASAPDLELRVLVGPRAPRAGAPATIGFEVENTGGATSNASVVHLYVDGLLVATVDIPALAPAEVYKGEVQVRLPEGTHALAVVADGGLQVLEMHEDNNGRSMLLRVKDKPWQETVPTPGSGAALLAAGLLLLAACGRRRGR